MANALAILLGKKQQSEEGGNADKKLRAARLVARAIREEDEQALSDALESFYAACADEE